jgi:hypothetical protein
VFDETLPGTFPDSRYQDNVSVVSNVYGTSNIDTAKSHWIQYGKKEKRDWSCHDYYQVLSYGIFDNLLSLKYLDMSNIGNGRLPEGIFVGLNLSALDVSGNSMLCVPLTNDQKGALIVYDGPKT